jgi:hypothetical protein
MMEIDPAQGPQFPAPSTARRRLWTSPPPAGVRGDTFTGYVADGGDRPMEVCWHVSRPGESAAVALPELKRRYPPTAAETVTGAVFFYGGYEEWQTQINGRTLTIGVNWPARGDPSSGTCMMYVAEVSASQSP